MPAFATLAALTLLAAAGPSFHSGVSLVRVDAEVVDGSRMLDGFSQSDFRVLDNRSPQPIAHFSIDQAPLDVVLLFDISGSMIESVEKISAAARLAFSELKPGDRVAVMVFNTRARLITPLTGDLDQAAQSIHDSVLGVKFGGGTSILSAVDSAARYFLHDKPGPRRRAIVVITDNFGQRSRRERTVLLDAWEADAVVCGLIVRSTASVAINTASAAMNPLVLALREGVDGVAQKTGGDVVKAGADPAASFQNLLLRLRRRYEIDYPLPLARPGQRREIEVTLSPEERARFPHARVRARRGYVVPAPLP